MHPVFDERGVILVHRRHRSDEEFTLTGRNWDAGSMEPIRGALFVCSTHIGRVQSVPAATVSSSISVVAFDPSGTSSEREFDRKDLASYLVAYVRS